MTFSSYFLIFLVGFTVLGIYSFGTVNHDVLVVLFIYLFIFIAFIPTTTCFYIAFIFNVFQFYLLLEPFLIYKILLSCLLNFLFLFSLLISFIYLSFIEPYLTILVTLFLVFDINFCCFSFKCQILENKLADNQLFFEFDKIPKKKQDADFATALLPDNAAFNRYKDVLPYEDNRLRLTPSKNNKYGYINASHITVSNLNTLSA